MKIEILLLFVDKIRLLDIDFELKLHKFDHSLWIARRVPRFRRLKRVKFLELWDVQ